MGPVETIEAGNAVACGDVNGDGAVDIYVTRDGETNILMLNEIDAGNHWFGLNLVGPVNNPLAVGARVSMTADGVTQLRQVTGGGGWLAMNGGPLHFGLGASTKVDRLEITWPDGTVRTFAGTIAADQVMTFTKGQAGISGVGDPADLPVARNTLGVARPNPFNPSTTIAFSLVRSGHVRLDIYSVDGRKVRTLVDEQVSDGEHTATWQGRDEGGRQVASGTYLYRLTTPEGDQLSGRMTLVK